MGGEDHSPRGAISRAGQSGALCSQGCSSLFHQTQEKRCSSGSLGCSTAPGILLPLRQPACLPRNPARRQHSAGRAVPAPCSFLAGGHGVTFIGELCAYLCVPDSAAPPASPAGAQPGARREAALLSCAVQNVLCRPGRAGIQMTLSAC